ncbi:insulinoma-associated protein 2-like [Phymastichus coffea]|uniref:insulinoma-associated protein 2-like n=1 Tax=Phymastichus coffea TaxID=108790 RepID=UPI00273BAFDB|nr:insulinoma-associated protein 2-like [Phymastichus coffea]
MLHSALPARAYLGAYLGAGYFEEPQPYVYAAQQQQQQQHESYVAAQRAVFHAWTSHAAAPPRPASPCPLDLSLKPPPPPPPAASPIEVDDEEDRRGRERARSQHSAEGAGYYAPQPLQPLAVCPSRPRPLEELVVDDLDSRSSSRLSGCPALLSPDCPSTPHHAPMTPPSTPSPPQCPGRRARAPASPALTPARDRPGAAAARPKRKPARRLKFDEDTSSPVSGTVILGPDEAVVTGDIDPAFNIVEVTEEARAELAKIENRLGPYQCKLCRQLHEDAFQLAQHRCSRIAHVEYRCPECDKRFSCPANLASHRRWHKPRPEPAAAASPAAPAPDGLACARCDAKFARPAALRKHLAQQHPPEQNNNEDERPGKGAALAAELA